MGEYYDLVKALMSDGKPRTVHDIAVAIGKESQTSNLTSKMKTWEKAGVCRWVGTVWNRTIVVPVYVWVRG